MNRTLLVLTIIFSLVLSSCEKSVINDPSLDLVEYRELGLPDPSKVWSLKDLSSAYDVLLQHICFFIKGKRFII